MRILIKGIDAALLDGATNAVVKNVNVYIEDDKITGIEEGVVREDFSADRIIEGKNRFLIPGMVNAHTHSYMSFMRNVADDLSFEDWLFKTIVPIEDAMTNEDAYWGANLAILEMIKCGTTCFNDMQMNIHQTTRAVQESGMRAVISRGLVGNGNDEAGAMRLRQAFEERDAFKECDRLSFFLGPHAPYTCDEAYLSIVAEAAAKNAMGIHIHLSESKTEVENCKKQYGCTPIALAKRSGLFQNRTVAAHCVQATPEDIDILSNEGVSVVTNPASNMKLGNGFAPIPQMMQKGVNICLGTDGAASNNSLNMFHELSLLTLIHKGNTEEAQCISAKEGFRIATINGAKALGMDCQIGSIEVGKKADLAILNLNSPSLTPHNNLIAGLAYSANGSEVETVLINGVIVMEKGEMKTMDEEKVYSSIAKIIERMGLNHKKY